MQYLVILAALFISQSALARLTDGKVSWQLKGQSLTSSVQSGFHFNKDAPAQLTATGKEVSPVLKTEKQFSFDMASVSGPFKISYYVCDDKNTVCEEHTLDYQVLKGKLVSPSEVKEKSQTSVKKVALDSNQKKSPTYNHHGFLQDDLALALNQAQESKQLVLVDVGAPWCPACIRLETEVFGTPTFKKATENVVKVALNSDLMMNKEILKKYNVRVLPTLLILNAEGEELSREMDFQEAAVLAQKLKGHFTKTSVNWAEIESKGLQGDKASLKQLVDRDFKAMDLEKTLKWSELLKEPTAIYYFAETSYRSSQDQKKEENQKLYREALNKWMALEPTSYMGVMAANDLKESYADKELPSELENQLEKNRKVLSSLSKDKKATVAWIKKWDIGGGTEFAEQELLSQWIRSSDDSDEVTKVKAMLKKSVLERDLQVERPGEVLMAITYMRSADMGAEEAAWLEKLAAANPQESIYPRRLARIYQKQGDFKKALALLKTVNTLNIEPSVMDLKSQAQVEKELKMKTAALQSINKALNLPQAKMDSYKSVVDDLKKMKKSL